MASSQLTPLKIRSLQPKPISFADLTLAFNLLASTVAYALRKLSASPSRLRLIMNRSLDHRFAHRFAVLDPFQFVLVALVLAKAII